MSAQRIRGNYAVLQYKKVSNLLHLDMYFTTIYCGEGWCAGIGVQYFTQSVCDWPFCELFFLWLILHWTEYIFACFLPCLFSTKGVTFLKVPLFTDNSCTWSPTILSSDHRQSLHCGPDKKTRLSLSKQPVRGGEIWERGGLQLGPLNFSPILFWPDSTGSGLKWAVCRAVWRPGVHIAPPSEPYHYMWSKGGGLK